MVYSEKHGALVGSVLDFELTEAGSILGHCASLPRVLMDIGKLSGKPDEMPRGYLRWTRIPFRG